MPSGLKPVRRELATGEVRTYWYHRATGKRLEHDPTSAAGLLEVAALDAKAEQPKAVAGLPGGSLAALFAAYIDSPDFSGLKERTRADYLAVRDWIGPEALKKSIVKLITAQQVLALRDKAAKAKGRRFGNYVLQVLRLVIDWGRIRGWRADNPAMGLKQIRKPTGEAHLNRAWLETEVEAFAAAAPPQLLVPFALGLFAGMRQGDALKLTWAAYDGGCVRWVAGKNDERCAAPATGLFKAILDAARERHRLEVKQAAAERRGRAALQVCVSSNSTPWTESGFRASFFKLIAKLETKGELQPGCTYQGLRHTIATFARDGQESEFRIAAAIGDRSTAMAAIYGRDADRAVAQAAVLGDVQKRFENSAWKTGVENASRGQGAGRANPLKR